jgi:epsin
LAVRSKAKELTALLQDDERLRQERANRSNMQSRLNSGRRNSNLGSPVDGKHPQRRRNTRRDGQDDDDEMRRAIEASKRQADEDEKKRQAAAGENDEDFAKAIKLSKEEEELRKSRLEEQNTNLLFDDTWDQPAPQPQPVYQQQQQVDFWGNPIDMSAQQQLQQSTRYLQNVYSQPTGFAPQQTGFIPPQSTSNEYNNGFNSNNPYTQIQPQYAQTTGFQPTPPLQPLSNNPYAQPQPEPLQPIPTGSNNPFAQFGSTLTQPQSQHRPSFSPSLSTLSEQQSQSQSKFQTTVSTQNTSFTSTPTAQSFAPPQKQQTTHQDKLEFLLSQGNPTGLDTFGNTGELRVPAHFNRTGFVNSAGQGLRPSATGYTPQQSNNPFFTGQNAQSGNVRPLTQSATGPAYTQQSPQFGNYGQQNQQGQTGSLIDF